jgi:hypothetical protein
MRRSGAAVMRCTSKLAAASPRSIAGAPVVGLGAKTPLG